MVRLRVTEAFRQPKLSSHLDTPLIAQLNVAHLLAIELAEFIDRVEFPETTPADRETDQLER